jgi:hypothetical protein
MLHRHAAAGELNDGSNSDVAESVALAMFVDIGVWHGVLRKRSCASG